MPDASPLQRLWRHIFGDQVGYIAIFAGTRAAPGAKALTDPKEAFYAYPAMAGVAEGMLEQQAGKDRRETYICAHLLLSLIHI